MSLALILITQSSALKQIATTTSQLRIIYYISEPSNKTSHLQTQHRSVHIGRLRRSRLEKETRFGIARVVAQAIAHDTSCEQVDEAWAMYRLCGAIKALLQSHEASP